MKPTNSRKKCIIGNWKMHTTTAEAGRLARAVVDGVGMEKNVVIAICPPFPYLALVGAILKGSQVSLGAQNLYPENEGAFTGEISPTMLLDVGCKYVILGHSERRRLLGETDGFISQKALIALAAGLNVILCVGETLDQRKTGQTETVLDRQLVQGLAGVSPDTLPRLIVAYEPVWAIGSRTPRHTAAGSGGACRHSSPLRPDFRGESGSVPSHPIWRQRQTRQRGLIPKSAWCKWSSPRGSEPDGRPVYSYRSCWDRRGANRAEIKITPIAQNQFLEHPN